jgi:hypothetical protein
VAAAERVRADQRDDLAVVEAHAVEDGAHVVLRCAKPKKQGFSNQTIKNKKTSSISLGSPRH